MQPPALAHVILGSAALLLGAGQFSLTKGTPLHRAVGASYVLCQFGLNLTALTIYRVFGGFGIFHVFALITLALLLVGFGAALLKRPRGRWLAYHYYFMGWSYVGLLAATATEVTTRLVQWPFAVAVGVPTVSVTLLGGACVELWRRRTLLRYGSEATGRGASLDALH